LDGYFTCNNRNFRFPEPGIFDTPVRAKNTAVSRLGFHNRSAMGALAEELAVIRWYDLGFDTPQFKIGPNVFY